MFDFTHYYGKHKQFKQRVLQSNVVRKSNVLQIRIDKELEKDLEELSAELKQDKSKVARDILTDFFLERHTKEWQEYTKDL